MHEGGGRDVYHFDHSFRAELHHTRGNVFKTFGELTAAKKQIQMMVKPDSLQFVEDSVRDRKQIDLNYEQVLKFLVVHFIFRDSFS